MTVHEVSVLSIITLNVAGGQVQNSCGNLNIHGPLYQWKKWKKWKKTGKYKGPQPLCSSPMRRRSNSCYSAIHPGPTYWEWCRGCFDLSRELERKFLSMVRQVCLSWWNWSNQVKKLCNWFSTNISMRSMCLKEGRQVKCHSKLANPSPILFDDIIRVGGRIHRAPIAFEAANPMFLPKSHHVSMLIVRYYHHLLGEAGREHVLSIICQYFWILRRRSLVRQILSNCVSCRRRNAPTLQQVMADLPKERLVPYQPPFTYTGLDFFGPFYVKRSPSTVKVYGCIFVCFNSRAVHSEDVTSLETDTFIQAFLQFISVRGCPKEIWSDNGTNFTGAEKELRLSVQDLNEECIKSVRYQSGVSTSCREPHVRSMGKAYQKCEESYEGGSW